MKRSFAPALCLLLTILARADDAPKLATVAGMVVKEPGDQPVKKVLLNLIAEDQKQGGNYTADTDPEGHFRFEDVQPGRYHLMLEKTGFHQINARGHQEEGTVLTLQPGQQLADLLFRMLPSAVITGKVVDEDGDPLANFGVTLMKRKPGKSPQPEITGEERTNDLGEYRFSGLFPGQYFLAVVPPPDIRNFTHAPEPREATARPDMAYLTTYYPGTLDSSQASPVDVHAGDEMPVNFTLAPARSYRIRGMVTGIPANQKPMVQLFSRGVIPSMNGADVSTDGQFEVRGVAPGSYSVTVFAGAEGQTLTARETVTVVAADVEGLKLVPSRPFSISGHIRFEGQPPKSLTQCSAYVRPADESDEGATVYLLPGGTSSAQVDRNGNFNWADMNPGTYVAQFAGGDSPDTFLKAVIVGGRSAENGFSVAGPSTIELVVSSRGAMLEGTVIDNDKPVANATVIAVPEQKYRKIRERFGVGTADQNGRFTIRGLPPGTYTVFAWQDLDEGLYFDPAFLKSQDGNGTALKLEEGSRQKVELKLSPLGEGWQ